MRQVDKFCKCIKSVKKTLKARPGSTKEQGAIAVCVKSVLQTRGRTMKKFRCGKKAVLQTQKAKRRGGVHGVYGWRTIEDLVDKMIASNERHAADPRHGQSPAKNLEEIMQRLKGVEPSIPAVTDKSQEAYDRVIEKAAPYPTLQTYLKGVAAWHRRSPLVALRRGILPEYN